MNVKTCLFGEGDSIARITTLVREHGIARTASYGIRGLTGSALDLIDREIATVTDQLLAYDVGDIVVAGWKAHRRLVAAARKTRKNGTSEVVGLASHTITWAYEPAIDLLVDGHRLNSLEFALDVALEIKALTAVVRDGCLASFEAGAAVLTAGLTLEGATLVPEREVPIDDLRVALPLSRPLPLA